ncbi:non-ribosomal peptide synthetase [Streptomyces lydicus]|nr:non-ribosomal peptide synthetase [Streptomyces lydicus]
MLHDWSPEGAPLRLFLVPDGPDRAPDGPGTAPGGPDGPQEVLAVVLEHTACDGQSLARIVEELGAAYASAGHVADEPSPTDVAAELDAYREAVLLQLDAEDRAGSPAALAYWGDRLRAVRERAAVPRSSRHGRRPPPPTRCRAARPSGGSPHRTPGRPSPAARRLPRRSDRALREGPCAAARLSVGRPPARRRAGPGLLPEHRGLPHRHGAAPAAPEETAGAWWDDLDHAAAPFDTVVHAARTAGSAWTGRLDGLLTVDDARRRPALRLGGVPGREFHIDGRPVRGPFAVSVTQGPELALRMVWDRAVHSDGAAEDAFAALTDALRAPALTTG